MRRCLRLIAGLFLCTILFDCGLTHDVTVEIPTYPAPSKVVWLDQNWSREQRNWYHHEDQGTLTFGVPLEWLAALEQPEISLTNPGMLIDPSYLDRYGFIPDREQTGGQPLPIGFARGAPMAKPDGSPWLNPQTQQPMTGVGLTCAACHTGRLTYRGTEVLIDGAPALTNLAEFRKGLGLAVVFTRKLPFRFSRFAQRVLGPGYSDQAKAALSDDLDRVVREVETVNNLDIAVQSQSVTEGFTRLDALNRIGDAVFALDIDPSKNYVGTSAPVHFPRIWNDSWFTWVQYNGSIEQPMVRNAGEALGVGAAVTLTGPTSALFTSTVKVDHLYAIEQLLAGKQPDAQSGFTGLNSPKWPSDVLPPINQNLAAQGAVLYRDRCQSCHLAPVTTPEFWSSSRWLPPNAAGERYLDLELVPISHIGTDPAQAEDMKNRTVVVPDNLGITSAEFGPALGQVVERTVTHWYDSQLPPTPPAVRMQMNGNRPNGIQAPLAYKVRPLNGIWASPPYLHNGSVPTLYALLSPVEERPMKFYLGGREYDPVNVGYNTDKFPGAFEFDTSIRGNQNTGHEFSNDKSRAGVIGDLLKPEERRALVEYLKTL